MRSLWPIEMPGKAGSPAPITLMPERSDERCNAKKALHDPGADHRLISDGRSKFCRHLPPSYCCQHRRDSCVGGGCYQVALIVHAIHRGAKVYWAFREKVGV